MKNRNAYLLFFFLLFVMFSCDDTSDPSTTETSPLIDGTKGLYSGTASAPIGGNPSTPAQPAGVITAGEWNDLHHWDFFKTLLTKNELSQSAKTWGFNPLTRCAFEIRDQNQNVLIDAVVKIKSSNGMVVWEGRTDNFGKAELWPQIFDPQNSASSTIVVYKNKSFNFPAPKTIDHGINTFTVETSAENSSTVDVMFVVDATGSMGDELEYLKVELLDVLERASETPNVELRTGSVFYRDEGDEYLTRSSGFTTTNTTTVDFVKNQSAGGGGDLPEAVHSALVDAVTQQSWSANAKARLLFLILDAPPHEGEEVKAKVREMTKLAAAKGIKIIPITASGIDKSTEFLMRFMSNATNGSYVFITNHSGIGNDHLEATVGDYEVEFLNDLMVRLIRKYSE